MNKGEERLVEFQFGLGGGFLTALFHAMAKADDSNLERFAKGFPEEAGAWLRFKTEDGYWPKLIAEYNQKYNTNLEY